MTTTANLAVTKIDSAQAQKEVTANEAFDVFDAALSGTSIALSDANYTLSTSTTPQEWQYGILKFTGALTAGRNIIVPDNVKEYIIVNATTGGFALTVKTSGGSGVAVSAGIKAMVYCDGTDVIAITPGAGAGTVTSVGLSSTDFDVTGSPVTTSGTLTANIKNDAVTYAKMQNVSATDKILGRSTAGAGDVEEITCTAAGRALLDDADAAAMRTTLGLGSSSTVAIDTDGTMAANSDSVVPSQKAVVTYVDSRITGGASDVMIFKGVIDCSANPNYPAADAGNLYKVSVAGKIGGASGPNVEAGDTLYCITDSTASGTHAGVGSNWVITQVNIDGAVVGPVSSTDNHLCLFDGATGKLIKDASLTSVLDQISSTQGSILYRGNSSWSALTPGSSGQVLRTNGAGQNPDWASVGIGTAGGGSSLAWPIQGTPSASGTSTASHGTYFIPLIDFSVLGLWALMTTVAGATYRVSIYQVNTSGLISAVVVDSADISSPGAVTGTNVGARFSTPPTLVAGNSYVVNMRRTDGGDTAVVGVYGLSTSSLPTFTGLPIQLLGTTQTKFATLAKATPAVGDTFTLGGNGYYVLGILHTA